MSYVHHDNDLVERPVVLPPPHVDAASWTLIQRLQEDEVEALKRPPLTHNEKCHYRETVSRQIMEDTDFAHAMQLAEQWDETMIEHHQAPQTLDFAYALQLKENWDHEQQLLSTQLPIAKRPQTPEQVQASLDTATALKAYRYAESKARESHDKALQRLQNRVQQLGFSQSQLDECLDYIQQEAPIVIHLTEDTLEKLVADTHYRSLFETNTSGGSKNIPGREKWERIMFGGFYDGCEPFLRPKYGCFNLSGDIQGVRVASRYGPLFLTLKNDVRFRCTFFDQDSGNFFAYQSHGTALATYKYYAHILQQYPDTELQAALNVSRISGAPSTCQRYKEVQIHGAIQLDSDIQALSVPGKKSAATPRLQKLVEQFQAKTNCNILWQGDLLNAEES